MRLLKSRSQLKGGGGTGQYNRKEAVFGTRKKEFCGHYFAKKQVNIKSTWAKRWGKVIQNLSKVVRENRELRGERHKREIKTWYEGKKSY